MGEQKTSLIKKKNEEYLVDLETDIIIESGLIGRRKPDERNKTYKDLFGITAKEFLNSNNGSRYSHNKNYNKNNNNYRNDKLKQNKNPFQKNRHFNSSNNNKKFNSFHNKSRDSDKKIIYKKVFYTKFHEGTVYDTNSLEAILSRKLMEKPNALERNTEIYCSFKNIINKNEVFKNKEVLELEYNTHLAFINVKEKEGLKTYRDPLFPNKLQMLIKEFSKYYDVIIFPNNSIILKTLLDQFIDIKLILTPYTDEFREKYLEKLKNEKVLSKYIDNIRFRWEKINNEIKEIVDNKLSYPSLSIINYDLNNI